ncbi:hypothetical protein CEXT_469711 [Caerostris extrusa]|uniref:Uncharacterized protein n=1 Tax=Caerostris extrusa TaxID=172846 RepID=A0AAV4TJP0_CAEEX|nr:hypothetical protein CEXT_469711 [Caerostris extrusa]
MSPPRFEPEACDTKARALANWPSGGKRRVSVVLPVPGFSHSFPVGDDPGPAFEGVGRHSTLPLAQKVRPGVLGPHALRPLLSAEEGLHELPSESFIFVILTEMTRRRKVKERPPQGGGPPSRGTAPPPQLLRRRSGTGGGTTMGGGGGSTGGGGGRREILRRVREALPQGAGQGARDPREKRGSRHGERGGERPPGRVEESGTSDRPVAAGALPHRIHAVCGPPLCFCAPLSEAAVLHLTTPLDTNVH